MYAQLAALHTASLKVDDKLKEAAAGIHKHHSIRAKMIGEKAGLHRDDDLNDDYLDSTHEAGIASRYF
jgi:hypothetical protein